VRVRLTLLLVLVAGGLVAVTPAHAAHRSARTVSAGYTGPGGTMDGTPYRTESFTARPPEYRFTLAWRDNSGQHVALWVNWQPPRGGRLTQVWCSPPSYHVRVRGGSVIRVAPVAGRCSDGELSVPTKGTVQATFFTPPPRRRPRVRLIPPADRWAVVIGITYYDPPTHDTYGGAGDAAAVERALLAAGWWRGHIRMLVNGAATAQNILSAMRWLVSVSRPHTFVLFHYSGHMCEYGRGPCATGHIYLWSVDNQFIEDNVVTGILGGIRGKAWLDFSGCESRAMTTGLANRDRIVSSSSQTDEKSYEDPNWHESVWTGFVFDRGILRRYADGGRPNPTIWQALRFGEIRAPQYTSSQRPYGPQHPYAAGGSRTWRLSWIPY
jgi:hypothetical protein